MTKKPSLADTRAATKALDSAVFINYDLDETHRKAFKAWAHEHVDDTWAYVDALLDSGYHVSVKWDGYNGCYGAFIICKDAKSENAGCILTGRGKSSWSALMGALYRHLVVFEKVWDTDGQRRNMADDE